jgi:hypothetical protein
MARMVDHDYCFCRMASGWNARNATSLGLRGQTTSAVFADQSNTELASCRTRNELPELLSFR